jgi:hypothetical protein
LDNTEKFQIQTHSVQTQDGNVTFPCWMLTSLDSRGEFTIC